MALLSAPDPAAGDMLSVACGITSVPSAASPRLSGPGSWRPHGGFQPSSRHAPCGPSRCAAGPPACAGRCWGHHGGNTGRCASLAPCRASQPVCVHHTAGGMRQGQIPAPDRRTHGVLPRIFGHTPSLPTSSGCLPMRSSRVMPDCSWPIARGGAGFVTAAVSPPFTLPTMAWPPSCSSL